MQNKNGYLDSKKTVTLIAVGGMLEFYDFVIYGIFAFYFAKQFFVNTSHIATIIESYMVLALGYVARPLGGIIFSQIGDRYGCRPVLIVTITLMGLSSLGISLLPTYHTIGIYAPILLISFRLIQGIALGGELPSAYVYLARNISQNLGKTFGVVMFGINSGLLVGMMINYILTLLFTQEEMTQFAWRIPFLLGSVLCILSYKVRQNIYDATGKYTYKNNNKILIFELFKEFFPQMIIGVCIASIMAILMVATIIFIPECLVQFIKMNSDIVSKIMFIVMIFNVIIVYITGVLIDRLSLRRTFRIFAVLAIFILPIAYYLISYYYHNIYLLCAGLIMLAMLQGMIAPIAPLTIVHLFPEYIKMTGVAISYNIGFTIFGALSPIIITQLFTLGFGVFYAHILYVLPIVCIFSIISYIYMKRSNISITH